jgi:hypothetical protein
VGVDTELQAAGSALNIFIVQQIWFLPSNSFFTKLFIDTMTMNYFSINLWLSRNE